MLLLLSVILIIWLLTSFDTDGPPMTAIITPLYSRWSHPLMYTSISHFRLIAPTSPHSHNLLLLSECLVIAIIRQISLLFYLFSFLQRLYRSHEVNLAFKEFLPINHFARPTSAPNPIIVIIQLIMIIPATYQALVVITVIWIIIVDAPAALSAWFPVRLIVGWPLDLIIIFVIVWDIASAIIQGFLAVT